MLIQVNTDNHIDGGETLSRQVEEAVEDVLGRFGDRITRVEVHLTDESSSVKSGGDDKRCAIEARLAGLQPIVATHQAESIDQALNGAAEKIERAVDRALGKRDDHSGRVSYGGDQTI